jgi:hypothetical protein
MIRKFIIKEGVLVYQSVTGSSPGAPTRQVRGSGVTPSKECRNPAKHHARPQSRLAVRRGKVASTRNDLIRHCGVWCGADSVMLWGGGMINRWWCGGCTCRGGRTARSSRSWGSRQDTSPPPPSCLAHLDPPSSSDIMWSSHIMCMLCACLGHLCPCPSLSHSLPSISLPLDKHDLISGMSSLPVSPLGPELFRTVTGPQDAGAERGGPDAPGVGPRSGRQRARHRHQVSLVDDLVRHANAVQHSVCMR